MLPASYATPAAAALIALGGLLACFAGYRLFRVILGACGFVLGALIATSVLDTSAMWMTALVAFVGGLAGAVVMVVAYFIGTGLVGAGLAAIAINLGWQFVGGEPPTWLLVVGCVVGALIAISVARLVGVLGTATAGAWALIVGGLALMGDEAALTAAATGDVWMFYPLAPIPDRWWFTVTWVALLVAGVVVQLATTSATGTKWGRKRAKAKAA